MSESVECPVCESPKTSLSHYKNFDFYTCPVCGRFEVERFDGITKFNRNHIASYLAYHSYNSAWNKTTTEYRYNTMRGKEWCDKYSQEFKEGHNIEGHPVYIDEAIVEQWYPKTFSERIDMILLYLAGKSKHIGQTLKLDSICLLNVLFIDVWELDDNTFSTTRGQWVKRELSEIVQEVNYTLMFLKDQHYIETEKITKLDAHTIVLAPKGYARVDQLQKNNSNGRNVLVAMKFGDETKSLREAIRKGIIDAGYVPEFIDEVQHNNFITPELLKHIRDSKFVVADLSHQNNGAYFEEGYAMGLGKSVIQLCKKDTEMHFDIAQKNTIIWENEGDIPKKLCNRIKATIE